MNSYSIDAASTNLTTSHATGQKVGPLKPGNTLFFLNQTTEVLIAAISEDGSTPGSTLASNPNQIVIPPGAARGLVVKKVVRQDSYCFIRSDGSSATSGKVYVSVSSEPIGN